LKDYKQPKSLESMPSVMQHNFARVPDVQIERSKFDRSHAYKTTMDAGLLVPFFVDEVLPGSTKNLSLSLFARLATPIKPIMDNMDLDVHYFFVPMRLVWENAKRFFGERDPDPDSSIDYTIPTVALPASTGAVPGSVFDYLGLPIGVADLAVNSLPLRAYNKIYNDWYRDENLIDSATVTLADTGDVATDFSLRKSGKRYDYFTSMLTEAQKGDAVTIPVGSASAPVTRVASAPNPWKIYIEDTDTLGAAGALTIDNSPAGLLSNNAQTVNYTMDPDGGLVADLSSAFATTINALRESVQLQALLEKDARGGTRYIEHNWVHFLVKSSDARLQRSEYLGGGTCRINLHPIAQTTPTTSPTLLAAQGNLAAVGTASGHGIGFTQSFEEHGYVIGIMRVRADLTYQQGLHKMWSRSTRYDFPYPVFAHIGEQAVLSKELYCDGGVDDDDVLGYQERYAECRFKPSLVTGLFRSNAAGTLHYWHLSQDFATRPVLDQAFIEEDIPLDRCIAVTTEPHFMVDTFAKYICAEPLPVNSIPTLGGRF